MHDGPELDERRREDDAGAPEANVAVQAGLPISVDAAPIASAIPAWLSASFASVAAAACGGGTDSAADSGAAQTAGTPTTAAPIRPRRTAPSAPDVADAIACSAPSPSPSPSPSPARRQPRTGTSART